MPLLRGIARTAVIAGTATAVSNRVSRRQGQRWAAQEQPAAQQYEPQYQPQYAAPPPPPPPVQATASGGVDRITALKELGELRAQGVLSEAEFNAEKARILAS